MGERVEDEGEKGYCDSSARKTGAPWGHEEHSATPSLKRIMSDEKEGKQTARQQSSSWAEFVKASTSTTSSTTAEATSAEEIQANTRAKGREDAEQLNKGPKREENAGISWYWLGKQARKSPVLSGGKLKCLTCGRPLHGVGVLAQHLKDAHNGVNSAAARTKVVGSKWAENIRKGDARERRKLSAQRESLTSIGDMVTQANNQGGRASQIAPGEVFHKREKEAQLQQRKEAPPGGVTKRRGKQREGQQRRRPKRATSLKKAIWREREQKGLQANEKASVNHSSSEPPAPRPADAPKLNPQAPSFIPGSGRLTGQKNCTYVGDDATFPWYSQQVITKRVNDGVTELCRQMKNFVSESRRKRRYVMGLREATNAVKAGKVSCSFPLFASMLTLNSRRCACFLSSRFDASYWLLTSNTLRLWTRR